MLKLQERFKPTTGMWLVKSSTTVGRNPSCDFIVSSNKVADVHIELVSVNDQVSLNDRSHGKSIFVNELPVGHYGPLKHGDVIRLADIELEIVDPKKELLNTGDIPILTKPAASATCWRLIAIGDWLVGRTFEIKDGAVLGRDASCDITIPGTHLSRRHVEFKIQDNQLVIRDLGSSNGTYVNDKKITKTTIKPGDQVRFDVLKFEVLGPAPEVDFDKTVVRPALTGDETVIARNTGTSGNVQKQWKTKPTSVGNRPEEDLKLQKLHRQMQRRNHWLIYLLLILLMGASAAYYLLRGGF